MLSTIPDSAVGQAVWELLGAGQRVPGLEPLNGLLKSGRAGDRSDAPRTAARRAPEELRVAGAHLLANLERSLANEKAAYEFLDSGKLAMIRCILCEACACGRPEESLLSELSNTQDPAAKLVFVRLKWQNRMLACELSRHPPVYPIADWALFIKDFSITEHRRSKHID